MVLEGLNYTGMSCFWRILLNFSETPERYGIEMLFIDVYFYPFLSWGLVFLEVLEKAQSVIYISELVAWDGS